MRPGLVIEHQRALRLAGSGWRSALGGAARQPARLWLRGLAARCRAALIDLGLVPPAYSWFSARDALLGLALSASCLWLAWEFVPEVHDFLENMPTVRANIQNLLRGF